MQSLFIPFQSFAQCPTMKRWHSALPQIPRCWQSVGRSSMQQKGGVPLEVLSSASTVRVDWWNPVTTFLCVFICWPNRVWVLFYRDPYLFNRIPRFHGISMNNLVYRTCIQKKYTYMQSIYFVESNLYLLTSSGLDPPSTIFPPRYWSRPHQVRRWNMSKSGSGRKDNTPPLPNMCWSAYSYPLYKLKAQRVLSSVQHSMK